MNDNKRKQARELIVLEVSILKSIRVYSNVSDIYCDLG